ncbi:MULTISPECIES: PTS ascorbate transporter subunit IIC [unclassified Mycoplasma]|uniref:PTS ascorbate transporter subunit IIC n=1 Tax=unclassified Mycoplasma TaxID=2683645 RepID=UPI00211C1D92|nr:MULTISPECIES: PTS ascorbate transporter subunit IIC [unclassified Mycoplasma]UUM19550.1 PTS ascorbate transporter subunit IIC [Mycoplasma sp. 1578d]UUM24469.1 PTS ascorbate transporter subunit IIC [Mycoplasma sp. 3686d]
MINKLDNKKKKGLIIGWSAFVIINLIIILVTVLVKAGVPTYYDKDGKEITTIVAWSSDAFSRAFLFLFNKVYLSNFFRLPAVLLGFLTFIGYLTMGRGLRQSIIGALKTIVGFLLLNIGSGALVGLAKPVFLGIQAIGKGNTGIVPLDPYFALSSANTFFKGVVTGNDYTSIISFAFILGYAINIVMVALKKWTNTNSLMITGHVMIQQSAVVTTILYVVLFGNLGILTDSIPVGHQIGTIVISGLVLGVYWATASTATIKGTNAVTQNAGFSIGHQQMLAITTTYKLGKFFGNKEDSAETKKLPSYLKIFEDNIFTQTIIILTLFLVLFTVLLLVAPTGTVIDKQWNSFVNPNTIKDSVASKELLDGLTDPRLKSDLNFTIWNGAFGSSANFVVNIIGGSLKIVAALLAIITGVRMFITELQQSFHGISEKIIPGAVVAVDVAAVYGFAINSVTFGFISGVAGQFLGVGVVIGLSTNIENQHFTYIAIPLFITLFFNSGSLGVYANASGGWKAALILPGLIGFLEIIIISFASRAISNTAASIQVMRGAEIFKGIISPVQTGFIGMADWNIFFGLLMWISSYNSIVGWILVPLAIIGMIVLGLISDNGSQTKPTFLQKVLRIKPKLVNS